MSTSSAARRHDRGFTLVELLIVIVILGVLATITVFAVRGITNQGQTSACASDKKNIETAEEANMAQTGSYASEAALVTNGLLHEQSSNIDVTVGTDTAGKPSYTVSNVGKCAGGAVAPSSPFSLFNRTIVGSGIPTVAIVGYGAAANTTVQNWKASKLAALPGGPTTAQYVIIDTTGDAAMTTDQFNQLAQADRVILMVNGNRIIAGGALDGQDIWFLLLDQIGGLNVSMPGSASAINLALQHWGFNT